MESLCASAPLREIFPCSGSRARDFLNLQLVKTSRAGGPKQADAKDAFAGVLGNEERLAFLVPGGRAAEGADIEPRDLPPLIVVQRDRDIGNLIGIRASEDVFGFHPARDFELRHFSAVDGKALEQMAIQVRLAVFE